MKPETSIPFGALKQVDAGMLSVGYAEAGPAVLLLHGWPYEHRVIGGGVGHNLPQEAPQAFAQAVIDVVGF